MTQESDILRGMLYFMGINVYTRSKSGERSRLITIFFFLILISSVLWYLAFILITGIHTLGYITIFGFLASPLLINYMWFLLHRKRTDIKKILDGLNIFHQSFYQLGAIFVLIIIYPVAESIGYMYIVYKCTDDNCDRFYSMTFSPEDLSLVGYFIFIEFSVHITQFAKTTFVCLLSIIYSIFCYRCRSKIIVISYKLSILSCLKHNVELVNVLRYYQKTLAIINLLENTFSPVMMILLFTNFLTLFTGLSILLQSEMAIFKWIDIGSNVFLNISCLVANTAFAAEIPQKIRDLNLILYEINEEISFTAKSSNVKSVVKAMLQREVIVLSAWNILYFNRSFILASVGSLFTYGIIIYQFSK